MKDDVTKVQISKTDITGDTEIPGAKLTILDKDDQVVESWTSTEEAHYIEKLPIGRYTLREEQAPKGYLLTSDVTFEVKDTGEIQKVVMKDDTAKGKVILNKTDKSSGEPLKGVEFEFRDSKGKVLETLKQMLPVMPRVSCMRLPHSRTANMIQQSSIIWWRQKHWMDTHWIRPSMK